MHKPRHALLEHIKGLRSACRATGAELMLAGETMEALVRREDRIIALHPQFLMEAGGIIRRTPMLHDDSESFLGWMPYPSRSWPIAIDRLAFKRHASQAGISVPALCHGDGAASGAVIVRSVAPTFEPRARGPYRSAADIDPALGRGEYCEAWVEGRAVTAWFWAGEPICAEVIDSADVQGDGSTTLGQLVVEAAERGGIATARDIAAMLVECRAVAAHRGMTLATVPPVGERVAVGIGHGSPNAFLRRQSVATFDGGEAPGWTRQLRQAGSLLGAVLPAEVRGSTLFALRATVDEGGRAWLLDMEASPAIHPKAYLPMVTSLLSQAGGLP
jgi:hypothetical protein